MNYREALEKIIHEELPEWVILKSDYAVKYEDIEKAFDKWFIDKLESLILTAKREELEGFVVGLKEQFAKHIVTETYDESKGEEIDGEVAMNVDKALSQAGPEIIDLFFQDWKEKKEL